MKRIKIIAGMILCAGLFFVSVNRADAAFSFENNLKWGMKNNTEVRQLQQFLKDQGLFTADITGNYFSVTYSAVQQFQALQGIVPASGYFGPLTRTRANSIVQATSQTQPVATALTPKTVAPTPSPTPEPTFAEESLTYLEARVSALRDQIAGLQKKIDDLRKKEHPITPGWGGGGGGGGGGGTPPPQPPPPPPADTTAPVLSEATPVPTSSTNQTPSYAFSSTEAGTITYAGDCSSLTTSAITGTNTITFTALALGTHSNCTIKVTDAAGNASLLLTVSTFSIIAATPPPPPPTVTYTLTITKAGTGTGTVSGGAINCGSTCSATLNSGTSVTLTATPTTGSTFAGWSGACTGTGTCSLSMTAAKAVTATFTLIPPPPPPVTYTLTVTKAGTGTGTVTGGTVNCGTTCTSTVISGTNITLTVTPTTGSTFTGWSGACTGTGSCVVSMTSSKTVTATFTLIPPPPPPTVTYTLTITKAGTGTGTVSGGAINCGSTCSATLNSGTSVTLTATPTTGSTFAGWSGACTGTGTCSLSMTASKAVTATFTLIPPPPPPATSSFIWGAYTGDKVADLAAFETLVGKPVKIQAIFRSLGIDPFPSEYTTTVGQAGKTLLIFWEPNDGSITVNQPDFNYNAILSGRYDANLAQFAAAVKAYGYPVILAPMDEMNSTWTSWGGTVNGNTPTQFAAVWIHIHSFFTNVPNVKFAWAPNAQSIPNTAENAISVYWPGAAYVDLVGVDGFNGHSDPWLSFTQIFPQSLMNQMASYGKPVYIFSMGSRENPDDPNGKANWITQGLSPTSGAIKNYPNFAGWIWFNRDMGVPTSNWLVNTSAASLSAFKSVIPQ